MDEDGWLAERFEENRTRLKAVAYRMHGSLSEADTRAPRPSPVAASPCTTTANSPGGMAR